MWRVPSSLFPMPPHGRSWAGSVICRRKQTAAPALNAPLGDQTSMAPWTLLCGEQPARRENHLRASDENFPTEGDSLDSLGKTPLGDERMPNSSPRCGIARIQPTFRPGRTSYEGINFDSSVKTLGAQYLRGGPPGPPYPSW